MLLDKLNEVLSSKKPFISEPLNLAPIAFSMLTNIIHWVVLLIKISPGSNSIVLHYNVVYGASLIDRASLIYAIPAAAALIWAINLSISNYFFKREKLAAFFVNISSVVIQFIFLAASLSLININD